MSNINVEVTYNVNNRKLVLRCPFIYNGAIAKGFPSKRFDQKKAAWVIPLCRKNVEEMDRLHEKSKNGDFNMTISPVALAEMEKLRVKAMTPVEVPLPAGLVFKTEPMDHQFKYLSQFHASKVDAVFAEMGTGKTLMATMKGSALLQRQLVNSLFVACPVSVRSNWSEELMRHLPVDLGKWTYRDSAWHNPNVFVCDTTSSGFDRNFARFLTMKSDFKVFIVGLESLSSGEYKGRAYEACVRFLLAHRCYQVIDEGHMIKTYNSIRSKNVVELGRYSEWKTIMTGSPVLQAVLDLFSYFNYLDPSIIGIDDFISFRNRYALLSTDGFNRVVGYDNLDELMSAIQPFVFQCLKSEVLKNLPPKTYNMIEVELTKEQREVYNKIKKEKAWRSGDVEIEISNALQKYSVLQTIISGFVNYDDSVTDLDGIERLTRSTQMLCDSTNAPKVVALIEKLKEVPHQACIIWSRYHIEIDMIVEALEREFGAGCAVSFTGRLKAGPERDAAKQQFLSGKSKYFVANQATGGVGLTLNIADLTIYTSNTFNSLDRLQSEDRNHRKGQEKNVLYLDIVARNTVDRDILVALQDKRDLADWVRDRLATKEDMAIF